jgi:hypothetical protein
VTNDAHASARIVEVRPFRVQDEPARGKVVIVAGYQGVSYKKEVTTLGRGGLDNVATSRARCRTVLVPNPALIQVNCRTPRQMRLANALCRLLEMAAAPDQAS